MGWDPFEAFSEAIGTNKSSGALAQATGNVLAPGGTIAPWAGNLNPLNPDALVGQMTRDVGALNPFNPDSTAGKVVNNIGKDMAADPAKWVAIAAAVATGQLWAIPYINGVAALTKKNSSPEEWLTEGVKAAAIQMGGEWVASNIGGVGPQTDITTGETFAGTGASGATGSAAAGSVAGNISRNIFATAARKGSTDINSATIITNALSTEGLKEAFAQIPGFSDLSKDEQSAGINAFKVAFNKDSNAATMLLNQGFQATYKELNNKALWTGYNDLNQQNTVTNYVISGGSKEDVAAFADQETKLTAAYNDYRAYTVKGDAYDELWNQYNAATTWGARNKIAAQMRTAWADLQSPETIAGSTAAYNKYADTWQSTNATRSLAFTALNEGWDSITQKNEAAAAGFTTPEAYDTYLTDKKAQEDAATAQAKAQADAQAAIDAEAARAAQEAKDAEEQAKRVADFNKDLTGGGVQNLGKVDTNTDFYGKDSTGKGAYKYDPETGNYTFTADDGSTITIDEDTNIVGVTEATDTPWTGLTDTSTGNIRLPKLPSGKTPNVNVNTMKQTDTGLPALTPLMAAGMFGALTQDQGSGYNPAPVQAPNVTMNWNAQPVQAPENGISYGQQFLNPTYSTGEAGGGLMSLAAGGMTGKFTTLGSYSDGGRLLRGPGDGMSDNIPATIANRQPARLADGEFVIPADVVSHLGNGSTDAGAKVLYEMMDRVRRARTGKAKQGKKIMPQKFVPN